MRSAFVRAVNRLMEEDSNVMLLTGDLGFSVFEELMKKHPDNFLNAGVAESNMIGMASGLALSGRKVFAYSIAPFIVYRALEQIRNDLCYQNLPVILVGVGGGLAYGNAGSTHHATEDIGIMVSLPNMVVIAPGDPMEVEKAVAASVHSDHPIYLRLNRAGDKVVHKRDFDFEIGKGIVLRKGDDILLIATGNMLAGADGVSEKLEAEGISCELISMHTLKPLDLNLLRDSARGKKMIVTIEEHSIYGGLASIVSMQMVNGMSGLPFLPFTLPDSFVRTSGSQAHLRKQAELDEETMFRRIISAWHKSDCRSQ